MSTMTSHRTNAGNSEGDGGWRDYFTTQRVIVIAFAVVEAVILGWAIGCVILRDVAR